jgi:hypothetical protein
MALTMATSTAMMETLWPETVAMNIAISKLIGNAAVEHLAQQIPALKFAVMDSFTLLQLELLEMIAMMETTTTTMDVIQLALSKPDGLAQQDSLITVTKEIRLLPLSAMNIAMVSGTQILLFLVKTNSALMQLTPYISP